MSKKSFFSKQVSFLNARMTSTISVSLVLFILGTMALMGLLVNNLSHQIKENISFTIVLTESVQNASQVQRLQKDIERADYAKSVRFISKEEALKEVMLELGENPEEVLGYNPLSASIEVKLNADYAHTDSLAIIEANLRSCTDVKAVEYRKKLVQSINDNMGRIGLVLLILVVVLMFISFALINNTIRLSVYSKRFLIHTMKLVGATPGFIRRPFIISNIINGIIASIIAMLMLLGCLFYFISEMATIATLITLPTLLSVFGIMLVSGIILTALSAYWAVSRYVSMDRDELYYI